MRIRNVLIVAGICLAAGILFFVTGVLTPEGQLPGIPFVGIGGTWKYPYITIGNAGIRFYWLIQIISIFIMVVLFIRRADKYEISHFRVVISCVITVIATYAGAKLLYTFECWNIVKETGFTLSGVSLFGAAFLVPVVMIIIAAIWKYNVMKYLDYGSIPFVAGLAAARIGCFFNGCCAGVECRIGEGSVILPTQLMESFLDLLILALLVWLEHYDRLSGYRYLVFMIAYSVVRFFIEFARNTEKSWFGMSHGQVFAIILTLIGAVSVTISAIVHRKAGKLV